MNRLTQYANPDTRTNKVQYILDHLDDQSPDEAATLREWLASPVEHIGHKFIANAITDIARQDGLDLSVTAHSVARYREKEKR